MYFSAAQTLSHFSVEIHLQVFNRPFEGAPNDRQMTVSDRDMTVTQGDTHRG